MRGLSSSVHNSSPLILFYDRASNKAIIKFVFVLNPIQEAQTSPFHHRLGSNLFIFVDCRLICNNVPVTDHTFSKSFTPPTSNTQWYSCISSLNFVFYYNFFSIYLFSQNQISGTRGTVR